METTLYASWFYIGGDYNSWVTLQNTSGGPINYQLTVRTTAGATLTLPLAPLAAEATALINIRDYAPSIPGLAIMGSVQVAHDGPLGAIRGNLANLTQTGMSLTMNFSTRSTR